MLKSVRDSNHLELVPASAGPADYATIVIISRVPQNISIQQRADFGSRLERNTMPLLRRTRLDSKAVGFLLHLRAGRQDEIR